MGSHKTASANIIISDFPDPDVIRVDDVYYMASTTMHFMPGCVILRSYNLVDWEFASYVYDKLETTNGQLLMDNRGVYGKGMWAASLRYHDDKFYVSFVANDTHKTYLFTSDKIEGPWTRSEIRGFYHDMSLFWDDDGRVFVVHGNTDIHLTELESDLSSPKKGGVDKVILQDDREKVNLGYEGSHLYKINGKYVLFLIHSRLREWFRTEACFVTDDLEGVWAGGDVLYSDLDGLHSGAAQGGIVDTPDGRWFAVLFQDRGAVGDDRAQVVAAGQLIALVDILLDLQTGLGHAGRIGQAQILLGVHGHGGHDLDLALPFPVQAKGFLCVIHRKSPFIL